MKCFFIPFYLITSTFIKHSDTLPPIDTAHAPDFLKRKAYLFEYCYFCISSSFIIFFMKTNLIFCCFLLPLAAMVFWGCPIQKPVPEVEILPEIKDNMVFKSGTYWIYIDSLSNDDIDSVYVVSSKDSIISQDEIYGNCSFTRS